VPEPRSRPRSDSSERTEAKAERPEGRAEARSESPASARAASRSGHPDADELADLAGEAQPELSVGQGDGPRALDPRRRYLRVHVMTGSAFLSEMRPDDDEDEDDEGAAPSPSFLVLHASFRGQRFRSSPVPAAVAPRFDAVFLLDLFPAADGPPPPGPTALLRSSDPVALTVTRIVAEGHATAGQPALAALAGSAFRVELVAAHELEWRHVLTAGSATRTVELRAAGHAGAAGLSAGAVTLRLELVPRAPALPELPAGAAGPAPGLAAEEDVRARADAIVRGRADAGRRVFVYARRWWADAVGRRPALRHRPVRIFAPDEAGTLRPVTSFVRPMRAGRLVESPRHAARFVALLPLRGHNPLGGSAGAGRDGAADGGGRRGPGKRGASADEGADEEPDTAPWHGPGTVLAMRSGSGADHATLLCSLLRGFGMRAYVAVGTWLDAAGRETTHEWVVTLDDAGEDDPGASDGGAPQPGPAAGPTVRFWEPVTGERTPPDWPTSDGRAFRSVACLFHESALLANTQPTSSVAGCSWDLDDEASWRAFEPSLLAATSAFAGPPPALCSPTVAEGPVACALERCLRADAAAWRAELGLPAAPFDSQLEHCLAPALAAYEAERLTGHAFGADDFRAAVRSCVPPGHAFQAFPFQLAHASPRRIAAFLRASRVGRDVVCTAAPDAALAVRVRVFAYPEDLLAVWVIVARRSA